MENTDNKKAKINTSTAVWTEGWPQCSKAFVLFIEFFQDKLFWFSFRKMGNREVAEEIVQEVFIKVFTERKRLTPVANVTSYLYRMVDNACTDRLRKRKFEFAGLKDVDLCNIPAEDCNTVESYVQCVHELKHVENLLSELPTEQAEVFKLKVLDELTLSEIADMLNVGLPTIKSRLRYGLDKIRKIVLRKKGGM